MAKYSIVIPLYNKANFIECCLESVKKQSFNDYEVIIINDGSNDGSYEIVSRWIEKESNYDKFFLYSIRNSGVSVARNTGVMYSKGSFIALLDADDYWETRHLEYLDKLVQSYSDSVDIFSCASKQILDGVELLPNLGGYNKFFGIVDFFKVSLISNGFINSSSVCIKKEVLVRNPFPSKMGNFEDIITWARISRDKGFAFDSTYTSVYRLDSTSSSIDIKFENYVYFRKIIKSELACINNSDLYSIKFLIIHILFARLKTPFRDYVVKTFQIKNRSQLVFIVCLVGVLIPRRLLHKLRNIRKKII